MGYLNWSNGQRETVVTGSDNRETTGTDVLDGNRKVEVRRKQGNLTGPKVLALERFPKNQE